MKTLIAPKDKFFRHKENKNIVRKILFLQEGDSVDNYEQVSLTQLAEEKKKQNSNK